MLKKAVLLAIAAALLVAAPAGAADEKKVLRIGWAQEPQTLNPFVAQDEEDFNVWSLSWDLLVGFSPKNLTPAPGLAKTWDVSPDKKTVTYHLIQGAKWSDGQPITSKDVKYSLETLGTNGLIFTGYTDNVTSVDTPDANTVVVHTKQPDARMIGGLFIYMIPEHVYGKVPVKKLTGSYNPPLPLVGSGPFIVTKFERGRILTMERNPNFRGKQPKFDEIQFIKYGTTDAVERAIKLGDIDLITEAQTANWKNLGKEKDIKTVSAPQPAWTELAFNLCSKANCPNGKVNPGVQDVTVRQAIAYAVDRDRLNAIATNGTSFPGHGILPDWYKAFYQKPTQDYPHDVAKANALLDQAGYTKGSDGIRQKGNVKLSFNLYVRSESPSNIQEAKQVAEQTKPIGVEFKIQVVSVDKLTELTTQKQGGKPAPDFDTFVWGWGGDPYDPSALLQLITTANIGNSSDSFYSNPAYDALFTKQSGEFDAVQRKATVKQMIDISQRDLPYLVLTNDPNLQVYRTDRLSNVKQECPEPNGDVYCEQVSYEPLLTITPGAGGGSDGGGSTGIIILIAVVVLGIGTIILLRWRRGRKAEPLELER